jgi:DNA-binding transcriptional LysR family regulator
MLQISCVRAFVEIADSGSLTEAAERLCVTQSAVSRRLAALEHGNRLMLVRRTGRQVELTDDGVALLPVLRGLLEQHDRAVVAVQAQAQIAARPSRPAPEPAIGP